MTRNDIMMDYAAAILRNMPGASENVITGPKTRIGTQTSGERLPVYAAVQYERPRPQGPMPMKPPSFTVFLYVGEEKFGSISYTRELTLQTLSRALLDTDTMLSFEPLMPGKPMDGIDDEHGDPYKVLMLRRMLAHETEPGVTHYGANLRHAAPDVKPLTIDAGGIAALIEYYSTHVPDFG